jgi:hypothetical protein
VIDDGCCCFGVLFFLQPGNFLLDRDDRLMLNDFDLSSRIDDDDNNGFESGTARFRSPYLCADHRYDAKDDCVALVFTVLELARKDLMDTSSTSAELKLQLLDDIATGKQALSIPLQQYVQRLLQ